MTFLAEAVSCSVSEIAVIGPTCAKIIVPACSVFTRFLEEFLFGFSVAMRALQFVHAFGAVFTQFRVLLGFFLTLAFTDNLKRFLIIFKCLGFVVCLFRPGLLGEELLLYLHLK